MQKQFNVKYGGNGFNTTGGGTGGVITREPRKWNEPKRYETKKWNVAQRWRRAKPEGGQLRRVKEAELIFNVAEEELGKFNKMYVGEVKVPGSTHMVQEHLSMLGIFSIKAIPLGANKVLMEEMEEGIIPALITDAKDLIYGLFEDIRKWSQYEVDNERLVWVRCHGVPPYAWNNEFFTSLGRSVGELVGVDENTRKQATMDVARLLLRTKGYEAINMVIHTTINGSLMIEEWCGPLHWSGLNRDYEGVTTNEIIDDNTSSSDGDDDPPLFPAEEDGGGWDSGSLDDGEGEKVLEFENWCVPKEGVFWENGNNHCVETNVCGEERNKREKAILLAAHACEKRGWG